jgi:hypothetical protein
MERKQVLRKLGESTDEEMRRAAYEAQRVRDQRKQTTQQLPYEFFYSKAESVKRKVKRLFNRPSV